MGGTEGITFTLGTRGQATKVGSFEHQARGSLLSAGTYAQLCVRGPYVVRRNSASPYWALYSVSEFQALVRDQVVSQDSIPVPGAREPGVWGYFL